jgi:hypothetical protein
VVASGCEAQRDGPEDRRGLLLWRAPGGSTVSRVERGQARTFDLVLFSADGRLVAVDDRVPMHPFPKLPGPRSRVCEVATGGVLRELKPGGSSLAFSPDGRLLARTDSADLSVIRLLDPLTGEERGRLTGHLGPVFSAAFSPDGKLLLSGSGDQTVLVWDLSRVPLRRPAPGTAPGGRELEELWDDLASVEAARAHSAVRRLAAFPRESVPLFRARLRPAPGADPRRIGRLVADLDDDQFTVRERAERALAELGEAAGPALEQALARAPSAEVRRRARRLLRLLEAHRLNPTERLRELRSVQTLEYAGTPAARRLLQALGRGGARPG